MTTKTIKPHINIKSQMNEFCQKNGIIYPVITSIFSDLGWTSTATWNYNKKIFKVTGDCYASKKIDSKKNVICILCDKVGLDFSQNSGYGEESSYIEYSDYEKSGYKEEFGYEDSSTESTEIIFPTEICKNKLRNKLSKEKLISKSSKEKSRNKTSKKSSIDSFIVKKTYDTIFLIDLENYPIVPDDLGKKSLLLGFTTTGHNAFSKWESWEYCKSTNIDQMSKYNNKLLYAINGTYADLADHYMTTLCVPIVSYIEKNQNIKIVYVVTRDHAGSCTSLILSVLLKFSNIKGLKIKNLPDLRNFHVTY